MAGTDLRVIVADDQESVRECVCEVLRASGHRVAGAVGSGEEAVSQASHGGADIVLMDIGMPGMGGVEAAQRISRLPNPVPVVFLTGLGEQDVARRVNLGDGFGYLVKPFHPGQLDSVVRSAVRRFGERRDRGPDCAVVDAAREALEALARALRTGGLADALAQGLADLGARLQARGVLLTLHDGGGTQPADVASWGERPWPDIGSWVSQAALLADVSQAVLRPGGGAHWAILGARLPLDASLSAALVVADVPDRVFQDPDKRLLRAYAVGLAGVLVGIRVQQPMAWRRWLKALRATGQQDALEV